MVRRRMDGGSDDQRLYGDGAVATAERVASVGVERNRQWECVLLSLSGSCQDAELVVV